MVIKSQLLVLASLVLLLAACVGESQPAHTGSTPDVFARTQQPADTRSGVLPEHLAENTDIDPANLRLLGMQDSYAFYAARDATGDICLINVIDMPEEPTIGIGCNSPAQFAQTGEFVVVGSGQHNAAAVFFPDGYTESVRDTFPNAFVQDNLLAFTGSEAVADAIDQHGGRVELTGDVQGELIISLAALR
jgi:hypothetical protein